MASDRVRSICALLTLLCIGLLAPGLVRAQDSAADPAAALVKQGQNDLVSQHYEDAVKAFKKANQADHGSCAYCYFGSAVALTKLGESNDALKDCDKAISCATDDALRTSSHILKGNILVNMGNDPKKLKAAESEYRAAVQLDDKNSDAILISASCLCGNPSSLMEPRN